LSSNKGLSKLITPVNRFFGINKRKEEKKNIIFENEKKGKKEIFLPAD
jgi:hypothetical protein